MVQRPPTVAYQIFWRDLLKMAEEITPLSREEKDIRLEAFIENNRKYILVGIAHDGVIEVAFHRNMSNYLKRNDHNVDLFHAKFLEFAKRRYGPSREKRH